MYPTNTTKNLGKKESFNVQVVKLLSKMVLSISLLCLVPWEKLKASPRYNGKWEPLSKWDLLKAKPTKGKVLEIDNIFSKVGSGLGFGLIIKTF